jgi:hypothetical protein
LGAASEPENTSFTFMKWKLKVAEPTAPAAINGRRGSMPGLLGRRVEGVAEDTTRLDSF